MENGAGTKVPHPIFKLIDDAAKQATAFTRLLQIHPLATVGQSKDQQKKNGEHRKAQRIIEENNPLIAPPIQ